MALQDKILVVGANGQIGTELTYQLRQTYGNKNVIAADLHHPEQELLHSGPFEQLTILNRERIEEVLAKYRITQVYHLAAILSAKGEKNPMDAWYVNMNGLLNVLEACVEHAVQKLFWPSSIAVFGNHSPKKDTPQYTMMDPQTAYGISKLAGERWCHYFHFQKGLDIRSLRYPGLISYSSLPGGGTTDYAVDIFYQAVQEGSYTSFLREDTLLPMMYMPDAIRAICEVMEADASKLRVHSSYNLASLSFTPAQLAQEIQKHIPEFTISYEPDFRQQIADSWPNNINDSYAREDWGWKPQYDIETMTADMLRNIKKKLEVDSTIG